MGIQEEAGKLAKVVSGTVRGSQISKVNDMSLEHFYTVRDQHNRKQKRVHRYEFNDEIYVKNGLMLLPITDVHLGNRSCNVPYFKAYVDHIMNTPNCVTILNGDLAETATKDSVGAAMFEEDMNIPAQLAALYQILYPLAQAGKILGVIPGNHEQRVQNLIGINPMEMLAEKLNVPYFGYQAYCIIQVNKINYKISSYHGSGGGATAASKTASAEKVAKFAPNADLYISGHTHGRQWHEDVILLIDENEADIVAHRRIFAVCGSFMEYWDAYAEMKALAPSVTGLMQFELKPDRKEIRVHM